MPLSSQLTRSRATHRPPSFRPGIELLEDRTVPSLATVEVFATGLDNPRGLAFGPNGHLYVAEAGLGGPLSTVGSSPQVPGPLGPFTGGYTGRISRINPAGQRHTLVDSLPSSQTTPQTGSEVLGPSALEFIGGNLYVLIEAGAANGLEGTFNGVFRVQPNGTLQTVANLSQHNQDVFDGIADDDHSPEGNPYSMDAAGSTLYITEANYGAVTQVNLDGTVTRLVDVASQVGHITPTGIAAGPDGNIYMGVIGEFPYLDGGAKIFQITPTGSMTLFADNRTAIVDLEFDQDGRLYALETFSGNTPAPPFFNPNSGRILRLGDGGWEIVVAGLANPTAMTFGPDGHLYVSHRGHGFGTAAGLGEILEIELHVPAQTSSAQTSHGHSPASGDLLIASTLGDFNNDWLVDVAALINPTTITVSLQNLDHSYTVSATLSLPKGHWTNGVHVGDYDHDGDLDVSVVSFSKKGALYEHLWPGNGDGSFGRRESHEISFEGW